MVAPIEDEALGAQVSSLLDQFHTRRVQVLDSLELRKVLRRKNPFLYRAIGADEPTEIVGSLLDASISSSDETLFGNIFFEPLALWVASEAHRGDPSVSVRASSAAGVDIEIETEKRVSLYAVKSGTAVFNSQSSKKQLEEFRAARSRLFKTQKQFDGVIAYSYGKKRARTGEVRALAGQDFWDEISGETEFYLRVIRAMGLGAARRELSFRAAYQSAVQRFSTELLMNFSGDDGGLDWEKLLRYNSGSGQTAFAWRS